MIQIKKIYKLFEYLKKWLQMSIDVLYVCNMSMFVHKEKKSEPATALPPEEPTTETKTKTKTERRKTKKLLKTLASKSPSLFNDRVERPDTPIDFILVSAIQDVKNKERRQIFESNLANTGLEVEFYMQAGSQRFVKIFAPMEVLLRYCEIMKLKMPLKDDFTTKKSHHRKERGPYTEQFSRNRQYLFDVESRDFMPEAVRYMIVNFILENERYEIEPKTGRDTHFGISKLLALNVYESAFPLHNEYKRRILLRRWASMKYWWYAQPVDEVKNYFGNKIALYFVWLEFYTTRLLIPTSIIGFLYMLLGLSMGNLIMAPNICEGRPNKTYILCPDCDKLCDFEVMEKVCTTWTKLAMILGNSMSVVYGILMALACVIYLTLWNRQNAEIVYNWGVTDDYILDYELPTVHEMQGEGASRNIPYMVLSVTIVLFWVMIVLAIVVALTFYRISLKSSEYLSGLWKENQHLVILISGGILDLVSIIILNAIYDNVATWLTDHENCRTHKQYEESLMWKLYIFWFINYYSTFFYIAFFKGRFVGTPAEYIRIFGFRQEQVNTETTRQNILVH